MILALIEVLLHRKHSECFLWDIIDSYFFSAFKLFKISPKSCVKSATFWSEPSEQLIVNFFNTEYFYIQFNSTQLKHFIRNSDTARNLTIDGFL